MNIAIQQLNHSSQQGATTAEQLSANAQELNIMAGELAKSASFFKVKE